MSTGFSLPQLRATLWARAGARVHALVDALVVPDIAGQLKGADLAGWDCLHRGALSPEAARAAPYLAELKPESPFTDWLLSEAAEAWPGWGVLSISTLSLLRVREHWRSLGEVAQPDGSRRAWRWHDPDVLRAVLPTFTPGQLDEVFAPGQQLVIVEPAQWTFLALESGLLATDVRPLIRVAA